MLNSAKIALFANMTKNDKKEAFFPTVKREGEERENGNPNDIGL